MRLDTLLWHRMYKKHRAARRTLAEVTQLVLTLEAVIAEKNYEC